jgi:hypothetical protein
MSKESLGDRGRECVECKREFLKSTKAKNTNENVATESSMPGM